ncbi:hypothetical protein JTE90_005099 [Oedothorax gibbosus]|uniref:Uncharacterized protein n=1 Tax=Oedothorax gibbosus TaxID=931172 RepID=A0AAV6V9Z5_9ARAC|nr:hypothetical protein JTE90_005099 [Oedothorax gibbosus]
MSVITNFLKQFMDVCIYRQVPLEDCINPQTDGIPDNIIVPVLLLVSTSALTVYYFMGRNMFCSGDLGSGDSLSGAELLETYEAGDRPVYGPHLETYETGDIRNTEPPPEMYTHVLDQDTEEEIMA